MEKLSLKSVSAFNLLSLSVTLVHMTTGRYLTEYADVIRNPEYAVKTLVVTIAMLTFCGSFIFSWTDLPKWRVSSIAKGGVLYLASTAFIHCIAVLYGAPLVESASETFHFSWLLATAAVLPPCALLGTHPDSWLRVFARNSPEPGVESSVHLTTLCSIIGAWLGAFPIPLDWDRPWQVWPRSCVIGTLLGYCVGLLLSAVHLIQQHRQLPKHKVT